jgi:transposase InsO family protein
VKASRNKSDLIYTIRKFVDTLRGYHEEYKADARLFAQSFNGKFRDQFLNGELFYSLDKAKVLIKQWRIHFNTTRPHQGLKMKPPAPAAWLPKSKAEKALHLSLFPPIPTPQEFIQRLNLQ